MYNRISYGSFSPYLSPMPDISRKEFNLLIALLLPTVIFGIFPSVIIETLDIPTTTLLYVTETPTSLNYLVYTQQDLLTLPQYFPTSTPIPLGNGPMEGDEVELINSKLELINILNNIYKQDISDSFSAIDFITNIQNYYSTLSFVELTATLNIIGCFIILFCIFTIIIALLSDYIITKFNITSDKYPLLYKFLILRKKIQYYYLILDFSIIITVVLMLLYINATALIT